MGRLIKIPVAIDHEIDCCNECPRFGTYFNGKSRTKYTAGCNRGSSEWQDWYPIDYEHKPGSSVEIPDDCPLPKSDPDDSEEKIRQVLL